MAPILYHSKEKSKMRVLARLKTANFSDCSTFVNNESSVHRKRKMLPSTLLKGNSEYCIMSSSPISCMGACTAIPKRLPTWEGSDYWLVFGLWSKCTVSKYQLHFLCHSLLISMPFVFPILISNSYGHSAFYIHEKNFSIILLCYFSLAAVHVVLKK